MAVRDKNLAAWQAYVITMAFISLGLLLGMFFLWRSYSDTSKRSAELTTQLSDAGTKYSKSESRVTRLKSMLGYADPNTDVKALAVEMQADAELGPIEKDFAEQMKLFSKNDKDSNLLMLPKLLMDTIRMRNEELDRARKREAEIQLEQKDTLARETAAREDAQKKMAQAIQDLESERAKHAKEIETLNGEKDSITKQFVDNKATFDKKLASQASMIATLDTKTKEQAAVIADQQATIAGFREDDFAAPQGEITRVADGGQTVWINLGSEDGLKEGVQFSVIPSDTVKVSKAKAKARLQVTKVVAEHLAQAKAIDEDDQFFAGRRKTIVTGDKVYSPAWRAGRTVGFALVGSMDVDGNFADDTKMVQDLIKGSGGRVDAVMNTKLEVAGKIGVGTAFIVLGADTAEDGTDLSADQKTKVQKYGAFIKEAKALGVTQMSLENLMGYLKPTNRIVPLGNRANGADFKIEASQNPPVSTGKVSEIYEKRRRN